MGQARESGGAEINKVNAAIVIEQFQSNKLAPFVRPPETLDLLCDLTTFYAIENNREPGQ
jgi:hypothetical protein